jgi:glucose-6-phosphate dehydrogenase assembly protein OpcA
MSATTQLGGVVEAVPLHKVEAELARQMSAGKDGHQGPVRRARMSNLVIFCNNNELADNIAPAVPAIIAEHPARVLFLIGDAAAESAPVTAATNVWYPGDSANGEGQCVCSEQVTLRAGGHQVERLPFAVRGLLIGDLPTNVWWAAPVPPPQAGPFLYDLAEHAQQIIYDSIGWLEPARGVAATASWLTQFERGVPLSPASPPPSARERGRVAADLNWRRLKYWRRLLAQTLDPMSSPGALESITEVLVEHGPHAVIQAWELVSWLASRLGWQVLTGKVNPGTEITWRVQALSDRNVAVRICRLAEGPSEVRRVRIACSMGGKASAFNVRVEDDRRLAVLPEGFEGAARTITVPPQTLADLVGRQLSDRERDPVFRDSMAVAQIFARSVGS